MNGEKMKNTKKILILMMILIACLFIPSLKVRAVTNTETEYVHDENGGTVNYYGTDKLSEHDGNYLWDYMDKHQYRQLSNERLDLAVN